MVSITETETTTEPFPIFKGAIYNTAIANNTNFFGSDLTPTNTPTAFLIYYVGNQTGGATNVYPYLKRTNGGSVVSEKIAGTTGFNNDVPGIFQTIVGPNDSINLIFPVGTAYVVTLLVIEIGIDNVSGISFAQQL